MSKKFNQRIPDGVINLSPEQIARDRKLRVLTKPLLQRRAGQKKQQPVRNSHNLSARNTRDQSKEQQCRRCSSRTRFNRSGKKWQ